jgi:pimeloyl-ACP methyl ester carboxylesterase
MTISYLLKKVFSRINLINDEIILIGSSFVGLVATRYCQLQKNERKKITKIILIAPALNYMEILKKSIPKKEWDDWKKKGYREIDHISWKEKTKLSWNFIDDLMNNHDPMDEIVCIPTLIIHGGKDGVIPLKYIRNFIHERRTESDNLVLNVIDNADHQFLTTYDILLNELLKFIQNEA